MLGCLSLDIICSSKLTGFLELRFRNKCALLRTNNVRGQMPEHIFTQNKAVLFRYMHVKYHANMNRNN